MKVEKEGMRDVDFLCGWFGFLRRTNFNTGKMRDQEDGFHCGDSSADSCDPFFSWVILVPPYSDIP